MFGIDSYWVAQILGFIGLGFILCGMQQKKYGMIVFCEVVNSFFSAVHYLILGGYTGMWICLVSCFTYVVYWDRNRKGKSTLGYQIVFGIMFTVLSLISWHSFVSIFVMIAKLVSAVSLGIKSPRIIRFMKLISFPCWLIYDLYMGSISGIIGDIMSIGSVVIGIVRLDLSKKKQHAPNREQH